MTIVDKYCQSMTLNFGVPSVGLNMYHIHQISLKNVSKSADFVRLKKVSKIVKLTLQNYVDGPSMIDHSRQSQD